MRKDGALLHFGDIETSMVNLRRRHPIYIILLRFGYVKDVCFLVLFINGKGQQLYHVFFSCFSSTLVVNKVLGSGNLPFIKIQT